MTYKNIIEGRFIDRPNRFIAHVDIGGETQVCHVKNTGRMGELLIPGIRVYLQKSDNPKRKTAFSLIAFHTEDGIINVDSQVPNKIFLEANPLNFDMLIPESKYLDSRFDFYVEKGGNSGYCEIKGVTLLGADKTTAYFPDAPTIRGIKHINHLIELRRQGRIASLSFMVKIPKVTRFSPNPKDEAFLKTLKSAATCGVNISAYRCDMTENSIRVAEEIDVIL